MKMGRRYSDSPWLYFYGPSSDVISHFCIVIRGKKIQAVERNRIKRFIRNAIIKNLEYLKPSKEVVVIARIEGIKYSETQICSRIKNSFIALSTERK